MIALTFFCQFYCNERWKVLSKRQLRTSTSFFLSLRKITWLNSQQPKARGHVERLNNSKRSLNSKWQTKRQDDNKITILKFKYWKFSNYVFTQWDPSSPSATYPWGAAPVNLGRHAAVPVTVSHLEPETEIYPKI